MPDNGYKVDPKTRFSSRVENYVKYRPSYPNEIISFLIEQEILKEDSIIADIGSGTGILSELFLKNGNIVYGIEPNDDMRDGGEKLLKNYPNFISLKGSAESTNLKEQVIDLITAGQAFHWFKLDETKAEFRRILKPNGYVILIWNNRRKKGANFSSDYEKFVLKYGTDYKEVRKNEKNVGKFFKYNKTTFYTYQELNFESLKGRLLSVSYIPQKNSPNFIQMLNELNELYNRHQKNGFIRIEYDTEIYYGRLN
jgi:ubiquinone/menaquinone biosynthesis C-methylase UbiE